uniref:Uncharacterized protein n=1 Tax=Arundo donax TaxID=35708 RepID=A0A0A9GTR3_ARUDO
MDGWMLMTKSREGENIRAGAGAMQSDINDACGGALELEVSLSAAGVGAVAPLAVVDSEQRWAPDPEVVVAGDEGPRFPAYPAVDADGEEQVPRRLVLRQRHGEVGRQRHVGRGEEGRPDGGVEVALVGDGKRGGDGDLEAAVLGEGVDAVVVDADAVVGVARRQRDLHGDGEVGGGGDVDADDGDVVEVEARLAGAEDQPDDEHDEEDDEDDGHDRSAAPPVQLLTLAVLVLVAVLDRHPLDHLVCVRVFFFFFFCLLALTSERRTLERREQHYTAEEDEIN